MSKQQWPVDFDSLVDDSVVPQETIEKAYACKYVQNPAQYQFKVLELITEIERNRSDLKPRVMGQAIRLMTDTEADDWYDKLWRQNKNSLVNIGRRRGRINRNGFDPHRQAKAESIDVAIAQTIITARSESKRHNRMLAVLESHRLEKSNAENQTGQ